MGALMDYDDDEEEKVTIDDKTRPMQETLEQQPAKKRPRTQQLDKHGSTNNNHNPSIEPDSVLNNHHDETAFSQAMIAWDDQNYLDSKLSAVLLLQPSSSSTFVAPLQGIKTHENNNNNNNQPQEQQHHTGLADRLKSQHDFHNPAFFQTVVQHFGIQEPLGSTVPCETSFQAYEYDLLAAEANVRILQQQQQQLLQDGVTGGMAPSSFAQQQLERALQTHGPRR